MSLPVCLLVIGRHFISQLQVALALALAAFALTRGLPAFLAAFAHGAPSWRLRLDPNPLASASLAAFALPRHGARHGGPPRLAPA